ncbi:CUE domain-containing protein 1-like isoform X2 [Biomphalaria glabrata]|uniref:CUE domain-containing protein 1-like isoform X2 n=1 Tax=Biomphalaria glabrata TaxID=6526 RepID=A0A9W2YI84_BIOGL|nr:CUE domain-containing protein 1-like isoform X2 [Biomphalaria glabrata]
MTETDNISRLRSVGQGEDSPGRPPGRPMRQLEFHQAMSDFRHMFPETDEEVIEAVLRANNGMVDATIDQLLTMNIDADLNEDDDLSDHILMSVERDVQQSQHVQPSQGLKRSGRETKHNKKGVPELQDKPSKDSEDCPPSYTEAVQSHMAHNYKSSSGRSRHRNSPTMAVNNGSCHHSRHTIGTMQHLLDLGPDTAPVSTTTVKRPAYRNWNPPMLGTLPDDFLRLIPGPTQPPRPLRPGTQLHRTLSAVGPQRPSFYPVPAPSPLTSAEANNSSMGQVVKQKASQKPHRSLSFAGHTNQARRPQTAHPSGLAQHEFSSDILQERMKENERRRHLTSMDVDPDMAQYLEDERLAIMLQNSEFLQELRGDRIFMMTLERDLRNSEKTKVEQPAEPSTPPSLDPENQDFIEGYGDDRRDTLEAFPFSQQLPPPVSEDVELRKKLKNMGKASRKQFAALARRFFLKWKKRSPQQILKESQAPSMMNLLDEDDDEEVEDQMFNVENNPTMESSCPTTHSHQSTSTSGSWHSPHQRHFDIV